MKKRRNCDKSNY